MESVEFDLNNIRLIVGLGNIGDDFTNTRHNAGFMFVEALAEAWQPGTHWAKQTEHECELAVCKPDAEHMFILAKPTTLMNASGRAVRKLKDYYKLDVNQIVIAHDDLDLPLGQFRFHFGRGPKDHNGTNSVENFLSSKDFWRMRLGIDAREVKGNKGIPGERYALERFKTVERSQVDQMLSDAIATHFALHG